MTQSIPFIRAGTVAPMRRWLCEHGHDPVPLFARVDLDWVPEGDPLLYWRDEVERGGFLSVQVAGGARPEAIFRFHNTFGDQVYPANTAGVRQVRLGADGRSRSAPVR